MMVHMPKINEQTILQVLDIVASFEANSIGVGIKTMSERHSAVVVE